MTSQRMEAFTDGVLAIVITIMVLDMKTPDGANLAALEASAPAFFAYLLSFVNVGIFWNNHHHMMHASERVDGRVLWANMLLLFWMSLVPFVLRWVDESHLAPLPTAAYGAVLSMAAVGYLALERALIACNGPASNLALAVGGDRKGLISILGYMAAIVLVFFNRWVAIGLYVAIALMWFIPDRRIESHLKA